MVNFQYCFAIFRDMWANIDCKLLCYGFLALIIAYGIHWVLSEVNIILAFYESESDGSLLDDFHDMYEREGDTVEIRAQGRLSTRDPGNIEAILSTHFAQFSLGSRANIFGPLLGDGIFTQDGAAWKRSRDLIRPQFMQTRTRSFPYMQQEIEKFISSMENDYNNGGEVDLQPLFFRLTLHTTLTVLCGESLTLEDEDKFAEAFDFAQRKLMHRGRLGPLYWLIDGRTFRNSCKIVHSTVDKLVASALQRSRDSGEKSSDRYILLESLISHTSDPIVLRDHITNILLAGRDTTASLLSWTFKHLARHQDIQDRLRAECRNLESFKTGALPTVAELKSMTLLNNILSEILRLYPPVPINMRASLAPTDLPSSHSLHERQIVDYCVYSMHRRKDIYGCDAEHFRPERWDRKRMKSLGWAYLPFNGGPRACLGKEFALLEAGYTVVRMLQVFGRVEELESEKGKERFRHAMTLVLKPMDGCCVRLGGAKIWISS